MVGPDQTDRAKRAPVAERHYGAARRLLRCAEQLGGIGAGLAPITVAKRWSHHPGERQVDTLARWARQLVAERGCARLARFPSPAGPAHPFAVPDCMPATRP